MLGCRQAATGSDGQRRAAAGKGGQGQTRADKGVSGGFAAKQKNTAAVIITDDCGSTVSKYGSSVS